MVFHSLHSVVSLFGCICVMFRLFSHGLSTSFLLVKHMVQLHEFLIVNTKVITNNIVLFYVKDVPETLIEVLPYV